MKTKLSDIIKNSKAIVHLESEDQEKQLQTALHKQGRYWRDGTAYDHSSLYWNEYEKQLCYHIHDDQIGDLETLSSYLGVQIFEFKDIDLEN